MKILKISNETLKSNPRVLTGFYASEEISRKLDLIAVGSGRNKSNLLRDIVSKALDDFEEPIMAIARRAFIARQTKGQPWSNLDNKNFKKELEKDLIYHKKLHEDDVKEILKAYDHIVTQAGWKD